MISKDKLASFLVESNAIEGIYGIPTEETIEWAWSFLHKEELHVSDIRNMVTVFQHDAQYRNKSIVPDVRVGGHIPMPSGPDVHYALVHILDDINAEIGVLYKEHNVYEIHQRYEHLHPFTDGNGRSGRMIWLWMMVAIGYTYKLPFLQEWYYQSLANGKIDHG